MKGITEVNSVVGRVDLIAILRVRGNEELAELVTDHILKISGIISSKTLIAIKV